jgi:hypothetical protein
MLTTLLQLGYTIDSKIIQEKYGIQVSNPVAVAPLFPIETTTEQKETPRNV